MKERRNPNLWVGWEAVLEPAEIKFVPHHASDDILDIIINDKRVGWIEKRPGYCDRGHWKFGCELPEIEEADRDWRRASHQDISAPP